MIYAAKYWKIPKIKKKCFITLTSTFLDIVQISEKNPKDSCANDQAI